MRDSRQAPPLFMLLFVSVFGFIGLTVIIFLWSANGFHEPPLIFKLFGSFIGIAFMIFGFGMPLTMLFGKTRGGGLNGAPAGSSRASSAGYKCPNCGAGIGNQEVSPSGDVKCGYCDRWYNIHSNG